MKKIMVATDFSERSDRALRRAVLLAKETDAGLELVHVVDTDRPRRFIDSEGAAADELLAELAGTLRRMDNVAAKTRIVMEDPFAGLVAAAEEGQPDLLVLGPHRRQLLRDAFVGTTAERTIRSVRCPLLMVNATPTSPYRHMLCATDLSDASRSALVRLAARPMGKQLAITVLHVFDAPGMRLSMSHAMPKLEQERYVKELEAEALGRLSKFLTGSGLAVSRMVAKRESTIIANEILIAATEQGSDLVMVATTGKSATNRFLLGSVAEQVLRSASVDVLVYPPA